MDRFELGEVVGQGGSGRVHRARDKDTGETVAVKIIEWHGPHDRKRFDREARLLQALVHPAIVRYIAHGEVGDGKNLFLAMEWLDGITLADYLATATLSVGDTIALARRVCSGLAVAHKRGVIHRDIKPANLFLPGGSIQQIKVIDFGLARGTDATTLTQVGVLLGTPCFMAPEQVRGDRDLDTRTDVFCLGSVLYRCVTGQYAFAGDQLVAVLAQVLLNEPTPIRELVFDVPAELDDLIMQMLRKEPEHRPVDADAVIETLDAYHESQPGPRVPAAIARDDSRVLAALLLRFPQLTPVATQEFDRVLSEKALAFRARFESIGGGTRLLLFTGDGTAGDLANRAARCALELRPNGQPSMVLASGRATMTDTPTGGVLESAATLLESCPRGKIRVDAVTRSLLEPRLTVTVQGDLLVLEGEQTAEPLARTISGAQPPFVGRVPELALLTGLFAECCAESMARAVLLIGEAGAGKTRLRYEFVRKLLSDHAELEVLVGQADALSTGSPFSTLAALVRRAGGGDWAMPLLAQHDTFKTPQEERRRADAIRTAWLTWMDEKTADHPVILVLEDFHWGDRPSADCILTTLKRFHDRPLMILLVTRPEESDRLASEWSEAELSQVHLPALKPGAAAELVGALLPERATPEAIRDIVDRAQGNPFFLEELARAASAGEGLSQTVLLTLQARLDGLPAPQQQLLRAASVFGRTFWLHGIKALLASAISPGQLEAELHALSERQWVASQKRSTLADQQEFRFRHALVADAAYALLSEDERGEAHLRAGLWLESQRFHDAAVLAEHFAKSKEPARAARWYLMAAEKALAANDFDAALKHVADGRPHAPEKVRAALLCVAAEAQNWRGQHGLAEAAARDALKLLGKASGPWFAAMDELFFAVARQGPARAPDGQRVIMELLTVEPLPDAVREAVLCLSRAAILLVRIGVAAPAQRLVERIASVAGDFAQMQPALAARVHSVRGLLARDAGDVELCLVAHEQAHAAADAAGDRRIVCLNRVSLGSVLLELGDIETARQHLERAAMDAETLALRGVLGLATAVLSSLALDQGDAALAAARARAAIAAGEQTGDVVLEGRAQVALAAALCMTKQHEPADRELERALTLLSPYPGLLAMALAWQARNHAAVGNAHVAIAKAREARSLTPDTHGFGEGESLVRLAELEALGAASDSDAFRAALAEAKQRLHARAAGMPANVRARFFSRPENAATLALC